MLKNISKSDGVYLACVVIFSIALFLAVPSGWYEVGPLLFSIFLCLGLKTKEIKQKYVLIFLAFILHHFLLYLIVCYHTVDADLLSPLIINASILYAPILPNPWISVFIAATLTIHFIVFNQGVLTLLIYEKIAASIILAVLINTGIQFLRKVSLERNQYQKISTIDPLTGLNTFTNIFSMGEKMLAAGEKFTLILMDIDNFKIINDMYGHIMGNTVIIQFSKDLQAVSLEDSICARLGGDEFLILLKNSMQVEVLVKKLKERVKISKIYPFPIHFSYGFVYSEHVESPDMEKLVQNADIKMYHYKKLKDEMVAVFDKIPEMPEKFRKILDVLKEKDMYTYVHSQAVAQYSALLAEVCGMDDYFIKSMYIAGWLHDIGKIALPNYILRKPEKLTAEEYLLMQDHVIYGVNLLQSLNVNSIISNAIKNHHEKYNGSGYPNHITGGIIPLEGRIMSITNVYAGITTKRIYREKIPLKQALQYLQNEKGVLFDSQLVELFVNNLGTIVK